MAGSQVLEQGREVTSITVWPSVASQTFLGLPLGQRLGQLYQLRVGPYIFTLGNLFCLLTIPLALILYFKRVGPFVATRYRLTNRRIVVERGLTNREERSVGLDRFDSIEVERPAGYEWYDAGDLVFRLGKTETFRLAGVSRPMAFREILLKAHHSYIGVKRALEQMQVA
jgi:hypothetical protein